MVYVTSYGQSNDHPQKVPSVTQDIYLGSDALIYTPQKTFKGNSLLIKQQASIPSAFDFHRLGLFCKIEHLINQKTKFPVKVRLGTAEYVDKLENK